MGMFDYVTHEGQRYQCKDTPDQFLSEYRIVGGRLLGDEWHTEIVPWNERPYPLAKGGMHICGSLRRVIDQADIDQNWHGYLWLWPEEGKTEMRAKFTDGNLVELVEAERAGIANGASQ